VEFRILGPLEVVDGDRPVTLAGARTRALLALLLTSANEVVSADRLIDELWGSRPPRTAANALQYHVSRLRKLLAPADVIVTREPGYLVAVHPDELDLLRFERLVDEARGAPPDDVARLLREALALWRGPPLGDLEREPFARAEIRRLEELRLLVLEQRIDADLALGRRADVVAELEALIREHPYREPLRAQLMRALYGAGRQADALQVYRTTRRMLADELGIEPGPALQQLEQAILRQDPALDSRAPAVEAPPARGSIVVSLLEADSADGLVAIAEALAREPRRELIVARLVQSPDRLVAATAELAETQKALQARSVASRVAAYTTSEPGAEAVLLATQSDSDLLLLVDSSGGFGRGQLPDELRTVLDEAPCDVALLAGTAAPAASGPIVAPFGGSEHDWSAIEIAAWLAGALGTSLRLVGTEADGARGRRDASRLLARASLLVQQVVGITTEPALVPRGPGGVIEAAADSRLLVVGLSTRWRAEGLGASRVALAGAADVATLFVRRGPRPGGLAPSETLTRFTWTLGST
jgi:DNA-binding SARP family transcriptional activator